MLKESIIGGFTTLLNQFLDSFTNRKDLSLHNYAFLIPVVARDFVSAYALLYAVFFYFMNK